jgi:hypothetical protein
VEAPLTPFDLLGQYRGEAFVERYGGASAFSHLFAPKTRALILDVLIGERGGALTAREIADSPPELSVTGVNRHRDALLDLGVVARSGKRGNAQTYALATEHPVAQVLVMLDDLLQWGETPVRLDERFVTESDQPRAIEEWSESDEESGP